MNLIVLRSSLLIIAVSLFSCSKKSGGNDNGNNFHPKFEHIVIVILENHSYTQIVNNPQAQFINSLLNQSTTAVLTNSHGVTHPSQPNYLCLFSGSNQGVTNDYPPANLPLTTTNLGAELIQNGFNFSGYCEDMPSIGYSGFASNNYIRVLNPWVNWQGTGINGLPPEANKPFSEFPSDFNKLPNVSIVIPSLINNMHNGTITASDNWIKQNLAAYIEWTKVNNSLFVLTFDEDDDTPLNQILTLFTGSMVKGVTYNKPVNHYNLLRTIEDNFKIPYAGISADSSSLQEIFR